MNTGGHGGPCRAVGQHLGWGHGFDMGLVDDFTLNWNWVGDWDIDGDLVDLELRLDTGHPGADPGVGADWGKDLLLGDGISASWSKVVGSRRDDRSSTG